MKRIWMLTLFLSLNSFIFGEIKVKVAEPMRFKNINTTHIGKTKILGIGIIEISTNNKEEDIGKKIKFEFPEYSLMTNRRNWIRAKKIGMEEKDREIILTKEREQFKFYAILDRKDIKTEKETVDIEGEYVGYIPIIVSQYKKKGEKVE